MIERPDVDELMAGPLGQWLGEQAQVRNEAKAKTVKRAIICAVILVPLLIVLFVLPVGGFGFFLAGGSALAAFAWSYAPSAKAKKETKSGINSAIASALGISYSHDCGAEAGFQRADAHKMLPRHHRSSFEDLWQGEIGGYPFALQECHLKEKRSNGKNTRYVTVFRGPVITIGFAREFYGVTLVERSGRHKRFGFFGEKTELDAGGVTLQKADMVHPDFEDAFTVYTNDQVEARYLVHPAYIERIIALEQAFRGQSIRTLFRDGELTVVLKTENMFESGSLDASRDREMVATCIGQFMSMAELAGTLNEPAR